MLLHAKQSDASVDAQLLTLNAAICSITRGDLLPGALSVCDIGAQAHFLQHLSSALTGDDTHTRDGGPYSI